MGHDYEKKSDREKSETRSNLILIWFGLGSCFNLLQAKEGKESQKEEGGKKVLMLIIVIKSAPIINSIWTRNLTLTQECFLKMKTIINLVCILIF